MNLLNKQYITAEDLTQIIEGLSIEKARTYINKAQEKMKQKNYFIPETKKKVALTRIFIEEFGWKI